MNNLYNDMNIEATEYVYTEGEQAYKESYTEQKSNLEELLTNVAKVLLTYTIVNEFLKLSNTEKSKVKVSLFALISNAVSREYKQEKKLMEQIMESSIKESYNLDQYTLSLGKKTKVDKLSKKTIEEIINETIDSKIWSDRLWDNKLQLEQDLKVYIKQFLDGDISVNKIEKVIRDKYSQNAYNSRRLLEDSISRCQNASNEEFFRNKGIRKLLYLAVLDSKTCTDCSPEDGVIYDIDDSSRPSLPRHPFCRCCYVAHIDGWKMDTKTRMDNESKTLIDYTDYKSWKQQNDL